MKDPVDFGLTRLRRVKSDRSLDGMEDAVFTRINEGGPDFFRGHTLQVQLAVSCGALLIGLVMAQTIGHVGAQQIRSETVVLSDDSLLAPSVSIEGGA